MRTWIALVAFSALLFAQTASKEAKKAFDGAALAAKSGKTDEAIRGFQKAIAADPAYAEAWCALGRVQAKAELYTEARHSFEQAIRADRDYLEPYTPLALVLNSLKDWKALAEVTGRLAEMEPYGPAIGWLLNATAHYNLRDLDAAEKSALEADRLDVKRQYPRILYLVGNIRIARGDAAGAADAFRRFLELAPADPDAPNVRQTIARLNEASRTPSAESTGATFKVTTELALVSFTVQPKKGEVASELRPEDIEIRDGGAPQKIAFFEGGRLYPRKVPVEVTLLFDASGSVREADALDPYVFEKDLLADHENLSIAISGFSDNLTRLTAPTRDVRRLRQAMAGVTAIPRGGTPLFGHIVESVRQAASTQRSAVRMLVVFSDGISAATGDETRAAEAIREAKNLGVAIYPVALSARVVAATPGGSVRANALEARRVAAATRSLADFLSLAGATGGQAFSEISNAEALPRILAAIATRVRYSYVAGYYPSNDDSEVRHKVEVRWAGKSRGEIIGGARVKSN